MPKPWFALAATLATTLTCAACGHADPRSGPTPTGNPPSAAAPTTAAHAPVRYEPGACPSVPNPLPELQRAHCATLVVPENRAKPGGRTLRLTVAVIPAETQPAAADPIVFLGGGPGEDAIMDPPIAEGVGLDRNRDLILLAQRGNHSSQPALT